MEREGYHPHKAFVPCVRERVGWNVTSDRSSANFAPICQNKTQFRSATKCQSQTESTGYYLLSPSTFSPALPLIQTSRRMSMLFVRNRSLGSPPPTLYWHRSARGWGSHNFDCLRQTLEFGSVEWWFWLCVYMSDYLSVFEVLIHTHWSTLSNKQTMA